MGTCGSKNVKKNVTGPRKLNRQKIEEDELTQVDMERLREERRQREKQEEELTKLIYAEKAALREITSRLIEKRASCESLMDLLEPNELLDISLDDASFRAQKRYRRKVMKRAQYTRKNEWMLYNNLDGIREPHMVHLALFMQKVTATLARIEAVKTSKALADGQVAKLGIAASGAVLKMTSTPPSSPVTAARTQRKGGRKVFQPEGQSLLEEEPSSGADCLELAPDAAGTLATVAQQNRLEAEFLLSKQSNGGDMPVPPPLSITQIPKQMPNSPMEQPPSPPPSPSGGSPRSMLYSPHSPGSPNGLSTENAGAQYSMLTGASLALRLGELLSPEDEQQLTGVQLSADMFENVRSSKSHNETALANVTPEEQEKYRLELLALQVCIIAPQTSYDITAENLYDYDLPPGLVTLRVARTVLNLYRRGGRLTPKSVLKLLRLGYKSLHRRPNTTYVTVEPGDNLTVVGDLHGQLPDLLHILETSGLPSKRNKYIFNGDFVDRGSYGVEVMCSLLALHIALPDHVILNRGNHEDFAICTVYGFQLECCEKYGDVIFGLFVEIFQQLPLFAVVNQAVIVLHGGLFHTEDTTLAELDKIDRSAFSLQDLPDGGDSLVPIPREKNTEFLKQLVRDALWSDPADHEGLLDSVRGAGVSFGPDVTRAFLRANNLQFVVRSHECVRSGYDEPYSGKDKHLLCTIFSASDYGGSGNSAAFLLFHVPSEEELAQLAADHSSGVTGVASNDTTEDGAGRSPMGSADSTQEGDAAPDNCSEVKYVVGTNLCYTVHYYYVAPTFFEDNKESPLWEAHNSTADLTELQATAANTAANRSSASYASSPVSEGDAAKERPATGPDGAAPQRMPSRRDSLRGANIARRGSVEDIGAFDVTGPPMPGTIKRSRSVTGSSAVSPLKEEEEEVPEPTFTFSDKDCVLIGSRMTLLEFIVSHLAELRTAFEAADKKASGVVSKYQWVNVMREVMGLHIRWVALMQVLVVESHFKIYHGKKMIDYNEFLRCYTRDEEAEGEYGDTTDLVSDEYTAICDEDGNVLSTAEQVRDSHLPPLQVVTKHGEVRKLSDAEIPMLAVSPSPSIDEADHSSHAGRVEGDGIIPDSMISPLSLDSAQSPEKEGRKKVSFTLTSPEETQSSGGNSPRGNNKPAAAATSPRKGGPTSPRGRKASEAMLRSVDKPPCSPEKQFGNHRISPGLMECLYIDYKEVESVFTYFDRNKDGFISTSEFRAACRDLNKHLPRGEKIKDVEAILMLMDFEETGEIAFNSFFELFRLSEMKLNVGIDEEDTLMSSLHHSDMKDIVRHNSLHSMSISSYGGFNAGGPLSPNSTQRLAFHGVEINVDSEFSPKALEKLGRSESIGLAIDV